LPEERLRRRTIIRPFTCTAALLLAACGPKTLTLPDGPVDRAATCGVVAAAEARLATRDIQAPLPLAAQGRILHYALLAASAGGEFSAETANRVSLRMSELQGQVTGGKWQELAPACRSAFPEAAAKEVVLPASGFDAQIGCNELADFVLTALESQESDYANELGAYRRLNRKLNDAIAPGLTRRAGSRLAAQQSERRRALAAMAKLGSPVALIDRCMERFAA
jgi:hypothetical protein